jgi:HEAT repeat protein
MTLGTPQTTVLAIGCLVLAVVAGCAPGDDDNNIRLLQQIGESGAAEPDVMEFLVDRLQNGGDQERVFASWAMGQVGATDQSTLLLDKYRNDPFRYVRINSAEALCLLGGPERDQVVRESMTSTDDEMQMVVLRYLTASPDPEMVDHLGRLLLEGKPQVRPFIAAALSKAGGSQAVTFLVQAAQRTDDMDKDTLAPVAFALGTIADPAGIPALAGLLEHEAWEVRANAVQALGMIGDPSVRTTLPPLLRDPNAQVRAATQRALGRLE